MWTITYFDMLSLTCYSMLTMSTFEPTGKWPYFAEPSLVYYYKWIQLYPVIDSSTWPFPIRKQNAELFKQAMLWLGSNKIQALGSVDYLNSITQTVYLKFTSEEDVTAFTLMFGELMI